jgi:uncharacterized lipoprotein NlpE involved in copper resistance
MKKSIFILMAVVLGMTACNDVERLDPTSSSSEDHFSTSANYYTLSEVEATLVPYGAIEIPLPVGYVPVLSTYNQIKCYNDQATPNYYYYVYVLEDASDVHTTDGGPSPFNSTWHSNENETGACYNPGSDCTFGGHYPDGETIIICNPDA